MTIFLFVFFNIGSIQCCNNGIRNITRVKAAKSWEIRREPPKLSSLWIRRTKREKGRKKKKKTWRERKKKTKLENFEGFIRKRVMEILVFQWSFNPTNFPVWIWCHSLIFHCCDSITRTEHPSFSLSLFFSLSSALSLFTANWRHPRRKFLTLKRISFLGRYLPELSFMGFVKGRVQLW